jgi:DNA-directed RNA polymerase specialized sigma24 family protein
MEASLVTSTGPARPQTAFPDPSLSACERFFRAHYPAVVRIAFGVTGDSAAAQDVARDVFIAALHRFPDPDGSDDALAWIRVTAAHSGLNAIRGEGRPDPRQQALGRLPRRAATVLVLRHSGLSYAGVAQAMHVTAGHVGTMLRRAESALGKELRDAARS